MIVHKLVLQIKSERYKNEKINLFSQRVCFRNMKAP